MPDLTLGRHGETLSVTHSSGIKSFLLHCTAICFPTRSLCRHVFECHILLPLQSQRLSQLPGVWRKQRGRCDNEPSLWTGWVALKYLYKGDTCWNDCWWKNLSSVIYLSIKFILRIEQYITIRHSCNHVNTICWFSSHKSMVTHSFIPENDYISLRFKHVRSIDCINNGRDICEVTHWFVDCCFEASSLDFGRRHLVFWG